MAYERRGSSGGGAGNAYTPGGTDVAVADGGTGASTAAAARSNLGVFATSGGFVKRTAGSIALGSTSMANVVGDGSLDITVAASTGDVVLVELQGRLSNENNSAYLNAATIVSGTRTNYLAGTGAAYDYVPCWSSIGATHMPFAGAIPYTVQAGDIVSGQVTFRPCYTSDVASPTKTLVATSTAPLWFTVRNVGPNF